MVRANPNVPARNMFSDDELKLLKTISVRVKITADSTISDVLLAIAGLGGHLKNNGPPGWLTLGRGYDELLKAYVGWRAARMAEM